MLTEAMVEPSSFPEDTRAIPGNYLVNAKDFNNFDLFKRAFLSLVPAAA